MNTISVLLPTRGRPEKLILAVNSLHHNMEVEVELLVGLDDDDPALPAYRGIAPSMPAAVFNVGPRETGSAACLNRLAKVAKGEFLWSFADDYVVVPCPDWPARLLAAARSLEGGLGLAAPLDQREPGLFNVYGLTRPTYEMAGYFANPLYPFWFGDREWDEIGIMATCARRADFSVVCPEVGNKTGGMQDLEFWVKVFDRTRRQRMTLAGRIMLGQLLNRAGACAIKNEYLSSPAFLATWGSNGRDALGEVYLGMHADAEKVLEAMK